MSTVRVATYAEGGVDLLAPRRMGIVGWEYGVQFDHVIPLSKGGTHTIENLKPAHGICNALKGNKYPFTLLETPAISDYKVPKSVAKHFARHMALSEVA